MRRLRYFLRHLYFGFVFAAASAPALGQVMPSLPPAQVAPTGPALGIQRQGLFVTAPVGIDGTPIIYVSALANPPPGSESIEARLWTIRSAIGHVLAHDSVNGSTVYDPETLVV